MQTNRSLKITALCPRKPQPSGPTRKSQRSRPRSDTCMSQGMGDRSSLTPGATSAIRPTSGALSTVNA